MSRSLFLFMLLSMRISHHQGLALTAFRRTTTAAAVHSGRTPVILSPSHKNVDAVVGSYPCAQRRHLSSDSNDAATDAAAVAMDSTPPDASLPQRSIEASTESIDTASSTPSTPSTPRKRWAYKQRKSHRHTVPVDPNLDWEKFEFSESPKWDRRFDADTLLVSELQDYNNNTPLTKEQALERLQQQERIEDARYTTQLHDRTAAWDQLEAPVLQQAIDLVLPCINPDRVQRIQTVLAQRTRHTRFLFENPANPSNVWACLRTIEAFGIQHVDIIVTSDVYRGKAALSQKRGLRTAMGSAQWLSIRQYPSTQLALDAIRRDTNCRFCAADLHPTARDIRTLSWTTCPTSDDASGEPTTDDRPICIVMGNEEVGISDEMRHEMDVLFTLPMVGFAESFNLSVATAITLAHLSAASASTSDSKTDAMPSALTHQGPLRPGDLTHHERQCLLLKGLLNSLPQKRMAKAMLKQAGIVLPLDLFG